MTTLKTPSAMVGASRPCRHCGQSIRFLQEYNAEGKRVYLPANTDGSVHRCLSKNVQSQHGDGKGSPLTELNMIIKMAEALKVPSDNIFSAVKEIGKMTGRTPAEVYQQAQSMLKLEVLKHGQGVRDASGNGTGEDGSDEIDDLVDQAVESALRSSQRKSRKDAAKGTGSDNAGSGSGQAAATDTEERSSNQTMERGGGSEEGTPEEGQGAGETSAGDGESVPQSEQGTAGQEEAGQEGKEGGSQSGKAGKEGTEGEDQRADRERAEVDKEVLKHIAQKLKEQIKAETTHTHKVELSVPQADVQMDVTDEHYLFPEFVQLLIEGEKPFLVGPAGSGKTTAALNAAAVLGKVFQRDDYQTYVKSFCMMSGKHELEGFIDANGVCQDTDFRKAFIDGHLYFMDEADAANPNVLLVLNAAIENGVMSFPDGMHRRHEHFRMGVGANTVGLGADAQYSGRTQLDAAFRNRFYFMAWEYDEVREMKWAGEDQQEWVLYVQGLRKAQQSMGKSAPRVVISPRASIRGARRLRSGAVGKDGAGFGRLAEALIWQGCHEDDKRKILANAGRGNGRL